MKTVKTPYNLSGESLDARNGAIAMNAYMEALRAISRADLPLMDMDFRRIGMLKKILSSAGDVEGEINVPAGSLAPDVQIPASTKFLEIEKTLAEALEAAE